MKNFDLNAKKFDEQFSSVKSHFPGDTLNTYLILRIYKLLDVKGDIDTNEAEKRFHAWLKEEDASLIDGILKEEYEDEHKILELLAYLLKERSQKDGGVQSPEVNKLIIQLLDLKPHDSLLDLCSGNGSFLLALSEKMHDISQLYGTIKIQAYELNEDSVLISRIASKLLYDWCPCEIKEGNALNEELKPFNKAFTFPPFGLRPLNHKELDIGEIPGSNPRMSYEWVFVNKILEKMGDDTKAVALLSGNALYGDANKAYKNHLIEKGLVEGIIELPEGSLLGVDIPSFLMIFTKNNHYVKLCDASSFKNSEGKLDVARIIGEYSLAKYQDNSTMMDISNWKPSSVLSGKKNLIAIPLKLGELAKVITGCQYTKKNFEKYIVEYKTDTCLLTSNDIQDDDIKWDALTYIETDNAKLMKFALQDGDVVITGKSSKIKVAVINVPLKNNVIVTGGMLIVRPNKESLNPTYLKAFLDSEIGKSSIKAIQKGNTIISINAKDLSEIEIPAYALEAQNRFANEYNSILSSINASKAKIKVLQKKLSSLYDKYEDNIFDDSNRS